MQMDALLRVASGDLACNQACLDERAEKAEQQQVVSALNAKEARASAAALQLGQQRDQFRMNETALAKAENANLTEIRAAYKKQIHKVLEPFQPPQPSGKALLFAAQTSHYCTRSP
jgi:peptidoglycan hydrolase CwlO-like protein